MKKLLLLLIVYLVLSGCHKQEEDPVMNDVPIINDTNEKDFVLDLDLSAGTGFEWLVVYQSDNVSIENKGFKVDNGQQASTGGRGNVHFEGSINDDNDGYLILKYARPWEGQGDYKSYHFKVEDNKISDISCVDSNIYTQMKLINTLGSEKGYLCTYIPSNWSSEKYESDNEAGIKIMPENEENGFEIFHFLDKEKLELNNYEERKIIISAKDYSVFYNGDRLIYMIGPDNNGLRNSITDYNKYFFDFIRTIDNISFEE